MQETLTGSNSRRRKPWLIVLEDGQPRTLVLEGEKPSKCLKIGGPCLLLGVKDGKPWLHGGRW